MKPDEALSGRALLVLVAALALVLAPHLQYLPLWIGPLFAIATVWRWYALRRRVPLPPRLLLLSLTLLAGVAVVMQLGTLFGRDAGVALLATMTSLKLLETRSLRDLRVLVFLGYLLAMANLLFTQNLPMAGFMMGAVLVLLTAQLLLTPGCGPQPLGPALRLAGRMVLQSVPLMLILFLLFPRIPGPIWGLPKDAFAGTTGLSDRMTPGTISELALSDEVAFRVRFEDTGQRPATSQLYWRGPVLWHYDGLTWRTREEYPGTFDGRIVPLGEAVRYTVTLEPHGQRWVYALDLPTGLPPDMGLTNSFVLTRHRPVSEIMRYTVASSTAYRTTVLRPWERRAALELPPGANARARALAEGWGRSHRHPARRVEAALDMFREQPFRYTLNPPLLAETDPMDDFLFRTRAGFCEHYAAAFVYLMRLAGVPARVVTGYQGGDYNHHGDYVIVRQSDAHAWAEVWLDEAGWVRIDPTGAISPERVDRGLHAALDSGVGFMARREQGWVRELVLTLDRIDNWWTEWVLGYGPETQRQVLSSMTGVDVDWRQMVYGMVAGVAGFMLAFAGLWSVRQWRARDDAPGRAWRRFCARLAGAGLARYPHEGPMDYAERVSRARPELARAAQDIATRYARLRFGPRPDAGETARLARRVQHFRP